VNSIRFAPRPILESQTMIDIRILSIQSVFSRQTTIGVVHRSSSNAVIPQVHAAIY